MSHVAHGPAQDIVRAVQCQTTETPRAPLSNGAHHACNVLMSGRCICGALARVVLISHTGVEVDLRFFDERDERGIGDPFWVKIETSTEAPPPGNEIWLKPTCAACMDKMAPDGWKVILTVL